MIAVYTVAPILLGLYASNIYRENGVTNQTVGCVAVFWALEWTAHEPAACRAWRDPEILFYLTDKQRISCSLVLRWSLTKYIRKICYRYGKCVHVRTIQRLPNSNSLNSFNVRASLFLNSLFTKLILTSKQLLLLASLHAAWQTKFF